jgi:hypothetical protein
VGDLLSADPWSVASLALRLGRAADAVADAVDADLSVGEWRGAAARAFEGRLAAVLSRLPAVEAAYADASRVVLRYAAELEDAQLEARRARALQEQADALNPPSPTGPHASEALHEQARRRRELADERHDDAARRAAAALRELADDAPRARRGAGRERFWSDARTSLWEEVAGMASLVTTAADALTGNRAARDELGAVLKESWRVWEPLVEVWHQLQDDRGGLAVGSAGGLFGFRGVRPVTAGERDLVGPVELAQEEAAQEHRLRSLVARLGLVLRAYHPGDSGMSLYGHEGLRGHGVRQHVAKSRAFMRWRADTHPGGASSTFPNGVTAQRALDEVVRRERVAIDRLFSRDVGSRLHVVVDMGRKVGEGFVKDDADLRSASRVYAQFRREPAGVVLVTIYPKVR